MIETPGYIADTSRYGISGAERDMIVDFIALSPRAGTLIPGSGGARKVRMPGRGKGMRGGYRVITYFVDARTPVYLLGIYAKSDKRDLTANERTSIRRYKKRLLEG